MKINPSNASCLVFTFKEGLLSKVAHDIKLAVTRFEGSWDGESLSLVLDPGSLEVVCAMKSGQEDPSALGPADHSKILQYVRKDILHPARFKQVHFNTTELDGDDDELEFEGRLQLHGRSGRVQGEARREGDQWIGELVIKQPDFGIKPFSAMLGTLKVKPAVRIELRLPVV